LLCAEIGVVNQPKNFGASLPGVYRQCAVAYTDFWESYKTVIPSKRHQAVGKETGQTNPIERLNMGLPKNKLFILKNNNHSRSVGGRDRWLPPPSNFVVELILYIINQVFLFKNIWN
jgi:hypothetical protein